MDWYFENPHVVMAVMALVSVSAACLITLYYRDERPATRRRDPEPALRLVRLSDYRREQRRGRRAA